MTRQGSRVLLSFNAIVCILHFCLPAAAQTRRALVVAISDYQDARNWKHISSLDDLVYIRSGLSKFGFTSENIDTLKNEQATKEGILVALDRLAAASKKGDIVVFYFCGHGQQIMDDNGTPDETDGYDESLVAYDTKGRYNPTEYDNDKHLRDDELGEKLKVISNRIGVDGSLLVMVDACHSGSSTRAETFRISRGSAKPFAPDDYKPANQIKFSSKDTKGFSDQNNAVSNMVLISASGPDQLNFQTRDENGKDVGSLSYAFGKTCQELEPGDDYYLMFEKIKAHIQADQPTQVPIMEGDGRREIFDGKFSKTEEIIAVGNPNWINDSSFYFNRGYLQDISKGSTFTLNVLGSKEVIATGYVARVEALQSIGVFSKKLDRKIGYQLKVDAVQVGDYSAFLFLNKRGKNVSRANALEKQLKNYIAPYDFLSLNNPADFMIDIATGPQDTITLIDKLDQTRITIYISAKENLTDKDWKELYQSILSGIRVSYIRNMPDGGKLAKGITANVVPSKKVEDTAAVEYNLHTDDEFSLQIRNGGEYTVYYNLIDIMPDGNIKVLVPYDVQPPAECQLRAGQEYTTPALYVTPDMPRGKEVFKFILSDQPIDLRPMIGRLQKKKERANMQSVEKVFADMYNEEDPHQVKKRDISSVHIDKTGVVSTGYTIK